MLRLGVELDSLPSGARVFLEGQYASELGETPLAVNPDIGANGRATIRLEKRGYAPAFVDVVPAANGNRLVLKLSPVEP